jgi:predicted nucleotidyltransferase
MLNSLLEKLAGGLDAAKIPYMIVGGQAVLVFGEPRLTKDIDVTLGIAPDSLPKLMRLASETGLEILTQEPEAFVRRTFVLPARDPESGFRVDFVFSDSEYERQALGRVRRIQVGGTTISFTSPEDLVIQKLVAGRERDLEDVKTILAKNPALDHDYIRRWLAWFDQALALDLSATFSRIANSRSD